MRLSAEEKAEIVEIVKRSELGVNRTLQQLGIHKRTFYNWYHAYNKGGIDALKNNRQSKRQWNSIPEEQKNLVVELALDYPQESPRILATRIIDEQGVFISESSVYRILKAKGLMQESEHRFLNASDEFHTKTCFVNEMWQTDFTYFKIIGWGWYYLSTVIDDYSRYIVHWELCKSMSAEDVKRTVDRAMKVVGLTKKRPPKLLSDNGPCYISKNLEEYLKETHSMVQIHGKPLHPQTQGKIERYHRSMKNVVKLQNYYCPDELEQAIGQFVIYYNNERYHESLDNLTPADVYLGRGEKILKIRNQIKKESMLLRRNSYEQFKMQQARNTNIFLFECPLTK